MNTYFEKQYEILNESQETNGLYTLGPMSSFTWNNDPKRLLFVLSRYKFAAKMLEGCSHVLEVGCGDGFGSRIVRQHVGSLILTDADPLMVEYARTCSCPAFPIDALCHNFVKEELSSPFRFDGAYLLDVLEHISVSDERLFFHNLTATLSAGAKVIVGMPSTESQAFASQGSIEGHVNCKSKEELGISLSQFFESVSLFSMNDELIHTGFARMANYVVALCVGPRRGI